MDDVNYGMHLEELHDDYVGALEKFASSVNLDELKSNLKNLELAANEWNVGIESKNTNLKKSLTVVTSLKKIISILEKSESKSTIRFRVGTVLALFGIILSIIGLTPIITKLISI